MPVTMRDVAREAGVSIKTVSRVVNNQGEISESTRRRVLAAIKKLGYRPSKVARALVTRRSDSVGLILGDIANPFFSEVARGVLDAAQERGYSVFLCNSDYDPQQEIHALHSLADHDVDGTIIFPCWENQEAILTFAEQFKPLVVVNRAFERRPGISLVLTDILDGARRAVRYLVERGHVHIGMLAGRATPLPLMQRAQGYRAVLSEYALPPGEGWIFTGTGRNDIEQGYEAARQLLTQYPQVTAIFAYNDLMAIGAIQACHELGRRVPEDCAVVGFDDIQFAQATHPPLTTVRIDKHELGRSAVLRLLEMLEHPDVDFPPIHLAVELVVRQSA